MNTSTDIASDHIDHSALRVKTPGAEANPQRDLETERRKRFMDPAWLAEKESDITTFTREIEDAALFHLADLLVLNHYTRYDEHKISEMGMRLLRPLAVHSTKVRRALDLLCGGHGSLKFLPKKCREEHWLETAPDVVAARIRERQEFMKDSVLSDLRNTKKCAAEARMMQSAPQQLEPARGAQAA